MTCRESAARGFSLIEVLIATLLIASAVMALAHLGVVGVRQTQAVRRATSSLTMAQSKLEELRAAVWRFDASGARVSDPALDLSSPDAIVEDQAGYVDSIDAFGEPVTSRALAVYRRRWAVTRLQPADEDTLLLQSCVVSLAGTGSWNGLPDACVSTVRTRKP